MMSLDNPLVLPIPECGCWIWIGRVAPNGYGKIGDRYVHRLSWQENIGEIPPGKFVLHKCDVRCCINPEHLFLGTQRDNIADMWQKGRQQNYKTKVFNYPRGSRHGNSKLTEEMVLAILADGREQKEIALTYGVSQSAIGKIKHRTAWKHVEEEPNV